MTKFIIGFIVITILLFFVSRVVKAQQKSAVRIDLTVSQFKDYITKNPKVPIVDVRTPEEFAEGHLKDAVNIPVNAADFELKISILTKNQPIMIYCRSGRRSVTAASILEKFGFISIINLDKGILGWQAAGYEIVK
jgi:rhodanese-related sulfurtransferase